MTSLIAAVLSGFIGWVTEQLLLLILTVIFAVLALFCFHFFRDPKRISPEGENIILSPADGKIVYIDDIDYDPDLEAPAKQVSIFLSLFNVHVNRIPIAGIVSSVKYRKGHFLAAFKEAASEVNEQTEIHIKSKGHLIKVKQIAGILARRILCYLQEDDEVSPGQRFGFIRFGSRTDLVLPSEAEISVSVGQKVTGGETIIGEMN